MQCFLAPVLFVYITLAIREDCDYTLVKGFLKKQKNPRIVGKLRNLPPNTRSLPHHKYQT